MDGGEGAHAHVRAELRAALGQAAFLRDVLPIGQQFRHDFEPGDNIGSQVKTQDGDAVQEVSFAGPFPELGRLSTETSVFTDTNVS